MRTEEHIERLEIEANRFAETLAECELDTTVVTCPEWSVRDLAQHLGGIHRWAAALVAEKVVTETWRDASPIAYPEPTDARDRWVAWLREGAEIAVRAFGAADPDQPVWVWGADPHARFWSRRMLFESCVHRMDLDVTLERSPALDTELAVEGVDEHFENLRYVGRWNKNVAALSGRHVLGFVADDAGAAWRVRLTRTGWWWDRGRGDTDVEVSGAALSLLLLLQGRPAPGLEVEGERSLLDDWLGATSF
jgi:uncharacterized protein (TIGR03083 family)